MLRGCHPDHVRNDLVTMSGNPLDLLEAGYWREVEGHVVQDGFTKPIGIFMCYKYQVPSYNRESIRDRAVSEVQIILRDVSVCLSTKGRGHSPSCNLTMSRFIVSIC